MQAKPCEPTPRTHLNKNRSRGPLSSVPSDLEASLTMTTSPAEPSLSRFIDMKISNATDIMKAPMSTVPHAALSRRVESVVRLRGLVPDLHEEHRGVNEIDHDNGPPGRPEEREEADDDRPGRQEELGGATETDPSLDPARASPLALLMQSQPRL